MKPNIFSLREILMLVCAVAAEVVPGGTTAAAAQGLSPALVLLVLRLALAPPARVSHSKLELASQNRALPPLPITAGNQSSCDGQNQTRHCSVYFRRAKFNSLTSKNHIQFIYNFITVNYATTIISHQEACMPLA